MIHRRSKTSTLRAQRQRIPAVIATIGIALSAAALVAACGSSSSSSPKAVTTTTPIQHVVVIFQENVSFDHYFGSYPVAQNKIAGEPQFQAAPNTPPVNGLS